MELQSTFDTIIKDYGVRYKRKQKDAFLDFAKGYFESLRLPCEVVNVFLGKVLLIGNIDKAKYLVTAHYDTARVTKLPAVISPDNRTLINLSRLFRGVGAKFVTSWYKPNLFNYNDNTSGLAVVMDIAKRHKENNKIAYALFDNEEKIFYSAYFFRNKFKKALKKIRVINLDCVGTGKSIGVLIHNWANIKFAEDISNYLKFAKKYDSFARKPRGKLHTDAGAFKKNSVTVSAFLMKGKTHVIYNTHSKKDKNIDYDTMNFLAERLTKYLAVYTDFDPNKKPEKTVYKPDSVIEDVKDDKLYRG